MLQHVWSWARLRAPQDDRIHQGRGELFASQKIASDWTANEPHRPGINWTAIDRRDHFDTKSDVEH
jgi:hypothetical protein